MSIRRRKTTMGETGEFHYEFMQNGKRYYGVCEKCSTEREAIAYEKKIKATIKRLAEQKSVKTLVENFRDELTGGEKIALADAYELSLKKPRKRQPCAQRVRFKRAYWNDFVSFMTAYDSDVTVITNIRKKHAEAYVQHLREKGRFNKTVAYDRKNKKEMAYQISTEALSNNSINEYHTAISEVFDLLSEDSGMLANPFSSIPKLPKNAETRDAFTEAELALIRDNLDDFTRPLFSIAFSTALREGDICTLKWTEINFKDNLIMRRKMRKTGKSIEIPMMAPLRAYLWDLYNDPTRSTNGEFATYVLPKHAEMYLKNPSGVSYRIKKFLEKIGIETTRKVDGRTRAVSVKDIHSCRHTFCYYAGLYGIPLSVVQGVVGHMSPEMTKYYSAHATIEAKREKMQLLPSFMSLNATPKQLSALQDGDTELQKLIDLVKQLPPDSVKKTLNFVTKSFLSEK